ncbi:hypothetical protein [Nocardiopsis halotolerans]|uniref:hypothetical protein n=1 Tax=Nocardiopsis halotolerans TaxID=124252 RepID=UPI00034B6C52|nr:hypothetical protein [Nocardiopsis halotolerans]
MDRGGTLLEYAALLLVVLSLLVAATAHGLPGRLPEELRGAVHRALGEVGGGGPPGDHGAHDDGDTDTNADNGGAATGHELSPGGDWRGDSAAAAEAVLRCARVGVVPDPVARVDCALALLGLLDSQVLEATILRLEGDELYELFLSQSFTATAAARAAVLVLWRHASEEVLRRLARTRTFGFLAPFLESPQGDWVLTFVDVGGDHVRATIERNPVSPRRISRHPPVPAEDDPHAPAIRVRSRDDPQKRGPGRVDVVDAAHLRP